MPIHPVSIVIGTTLAVIGSGYVFKKFVYDPHLAPYIDAILDGRPLPSREEAISHRQSSPRQAVAVPTVARSSAIRGPPVTLRRRSRSTEVEHEREPLIRTKEDWEKTYELSQYGEVLSPGRSLEGILLPKLDSTVDENTFRRDRRVSDPLIDLDGVIFAYPDRTLQPEISTFHRDQTRSYAAAGESSNTPRTSIPAPSETFQTFESWAVPSPPRSPRGHRRTPSQSLSQVLSTATSPHRVLSPPSRPDDMISLVDSQFSGMSGYEDAETYSPEQSRLLAFPSGNPNNQVVYQTPFVSLDTGLPNTGIAITDTLQRGPMSVISLSESEGWRSGASDDWEITSEA